MEKEIISGIENFRESHHVETRLADTGSKLPQLIARTLEFKHQLDMTDRIYKNGWRPDGHGHGHWESQSIGETAFNNFQREFRSLQASRPSNYTGRIQFIKVNNSDPKEVRRIVLRRRGQGKGIHEETHNGRESFAIGVKIIPYPNSICVVYVGIMVVFPRPDEAELVGQRVTR